ncbi:hypothetical protein [Promicromonospora sp. NPDC060271]|uniref:hypothetical protein n=1 Tax=Promicromonospora sp. NPDC060271 TaxID=3347089 RepID=UPI00366668C6
MLGHKKGKLSGAKATGVGIALCLTGVVGMLGAIRATAADIEGPIQTPEVTPEPTPEPTATDDGLIEVVPEGPLITWPRCEGDKYIPPTLRPAPDSDGVWYEFEIGWYDLPFLVPLDLEVYANVKAGYTWAEEMPDGWSTKDGVYDAVFKVRFEDVPCAPHPDPVVPEVPVVTQAECVDGELTEPTVTLPENGHGISYELFESESEPTHQVVAGIAWSYKWADEEDFPDGWTSNGVDAAWYDVKFDDVSCEPGAEQPRQPEELAATGPSDAAVLGGAALLTVAAGVSLIVARRRVTGR